MKNLKSGNVIKVTIADDHILFRYGVKSSISSYKDIQMVAEAENGIQLLSILNCIQTDIVLLDIKMPIMDGLATLQEIKKLYPKLKVIMLSMHNDYTFISHVMKFGANGYLTKDSGIEKIYQAVKEVYENEFFFSEYHNKVAV
jgi:DNA-binding NarL/FixJ family response regulator